MTAKRQPSGKARVGEQLNQSNIFTDVVTLTGYAEIDLHRLIATKGGTVKRVQSYAVIGLLFEDAGGATAEIAQRLSSKIGADGKLNIYAEQALDDSGVTWIPASAPITVRWTVLQTN